MRSHLVVEVLIVGQGLVGVGDGEVALVEVPEFDAGAVVGAFHATVELGPSRCRDRWSICTSSPGRWARWPYRQRWAWPLKPRRRLSLTRPRQKAQGWMRPRAHALGEDASEGDRNRLAGTTGRRRATPRQEPRCRLHGKLRRWAGTRLNAIHARLKHGRFGNPSKWICGQIRAGVPTLSA